MNMSSYQEFVSIFEFVKKARDYEENGIKLRMPILKKKYEKMGVTDEENILLLEKRKTTSNIRDVEIFLNSSQVFELDEKHKYLLMLTNNPRMEDEELWKQVRLPFPELFIDVNFSNADFDFPSEDGKISGILIKEIKRIGVQMDAGSKTITKGNIYGLCAYVVGLTVDGLPFLDKIDFPIYGDNVDYSNIVYEDKKGAEFIKRFIVNFVLFLKDREVVYVESHRDVKNQERRVKSGKMALPSSRIVKLTGELKRYVDSLQENDFRGKLGYQFWVRGHWRTYRSAKYTNVRDKVQWIEPFKKGKGIEVKRVYRVLPNDEKDTLNYDDIEAGTRKLKNIKR